MASVISFQQVRAAVLLALDGARDVNTRRYPEPEDFHDPQRVAIYLLRECGAGESDERSAENLFDFLERLDLLDSAVAAFLMAGLMDYVGYRHDIYDSIDFYLRELPKETLSSLQEFAARTSRESGEIFDRWLEE